MAAGVGGSSPVLLSPGWGAGPDHVPALEIKLGALVVLLATTLLCGFVPLCVVRGAGGCSVDSELRRRLLGLVSCFAGGVFLATCLLDLLPDYLQSISQAFTAGGRRQEKRVGNWRGHFWENHCVCVCVCVCARTRQA
uniref:Solute carrier family 39 member 1 n=1 Tax=Myripristis murdjan TaxID=586833 RepID=A0A667ZBW8_9TELE